MRLAGQALSDDSGTSGEVNAAINKALKNPHNGFDQEISSHHADLDRGTEGIINDGVDRSILYKGGNTIEAEIEGLGNPLPNQPAGSREMREIPQERLDELHQIWNENDIRRTGTGNMAQGMSAGYHGTDNTLGFGAQNYLG